MKKLIIVLFLFSLILSLCACGGGVGKVSSATDPLGYFMSTRNWSLSEIEKQFGHFESSHEEKSHMYSFTQYDNSNVSVFGESWSFYVRISDYTDRGIQHSGNFSFAQKNISDKAFVAYRDDIIAHYTKLYGYPNQLYASSSMPAWVWTTPNLTIVLQDCRPETGNMNLTFTL